MTIFSGTVKGSPLFAIVKSSLGIEHCVSHSDTENTCHDDNEDTNDNCCGDMDCDCTCCVHIMILTSLVDFDFIQEGYSNDKYGYVWDYQRDYLSNIFHPPSLG